MVDACVYTRLSKDTRDEDDEESLGVARQEKDCRALADRLGLTVARVYCDDGVSAYSGKRRPQYEAMLTDVARGRYGAILAWHPDRLHRNMRDLERLIDVLDAAGAPVHTVNGGDMDLSTASGKMIARILGSVARQESEHKGERIAAAFAQRAEAGTWFVNVRVFGYTMDGDIIPDEAALIRQAASAVLTGASLRSIERDWNTRGIATTKGNQWRPATVKRLLVNPRLAGLVEYRGKVVGPGQWAPIIHPDDHAGLVAILNAPGRGKATVRERRYIGSFRYLCGRCGSGMQHFIDIHRNHKYRCYKHAHLARAQAPVDALVEEVALSFLRNNTAVATALAEAERDSGPGADIVNLRARHAALSAQKSELATLFADGVLDGPAVRRESAKITEKISDVEAALGRAAQRSPLADMLGGGDIEKRWRDASPDTKGRIIDSLFTVVIHPVPKGGKGPGFNPDLIEFRWHHG